MLMAVMLMPFLFQLNCVIPNKAVIKPRIMQRLEKSTFRATFNKTFIVSNPTIKEITTARIEEKSTVIKCLICNTISTPKIAGILIKEWKKNKL